MKKLISALTLKSVSISIQRKRIFILTVALFVALLVTPQTSFNITFPLPYTVEVIRLATLVIAVNVFANIIRIFIVSSHRKRRNISNQEKDNFTVGLNALVNAVTVIAFILFFFIVFNIEFRSFLNTFALFGVAFTLIFIDFIKNFLYGLTMMFSADYEIGDYIQVGDIEKGVITTITFSSVQLKTETGDLLFIPNSLMRTHEVVNYSKLRPKRITIEFTVLRTQLHSVDSFEKDLLAELITAFPNTFEIEKAYLRIKETSKDDVVFILEAPTKKASLILKEKAETIVQKFAVEYSTE